MRVWNCMLAGRPAALALVIAVTGCAAPSTQPVPAKATAAETTPALSTAAGFDGTYRGDSLPSQIVEGCGARAREITIEIRGSRAWTHHSHPSLDGTVDPSGQVSMQNSDATSSLTGVIQGDVLTGTETTSDAPGKLQGFYASAQSTCTFAIQATRVPGDSG